MIENTINFARLNPWTIGFTCLSLFLFFIILFLVNGKKRNKKDAKLNIIGLNLFMLFMIGIVAACIFVIATTPKFATLLDKEDEFVLIYWICIGGLWGFVKYVTGIDPDEIF